MNNSDMRDSLAALDREILAAKDKLQSLRKEALELLAFANTASAKGAADYSEDLGIDLAILRERAVYMRSKALALAGLTASVSKATEGFLCEVPGAMDHVKTQEYISFYSNLRRAFRNLFRFLWLSRKVVVD
jgi:hypothetical protein